MKGLLIKDILLLKTQKRFLAFGIILLLMAVNDYTFAVGYITWLTMVALLTLSYDETDNGCAFLFTMPIDRTLYTTEKYLLSLLIGFAGWAVTTLVSVVLGIINSADIIAEIILPNLRLMPIMLIMQAVIIPFQIKFGAEKCRLAFIIFVTVLCGSIIGISKIAGVDTDSFLGWIFSLSTWAIIAVAALISVLAYAISMKISINIIKKKEF